tara:strand:- start:14681 stop:14866 length:186 start_codon:yes stop_codon:yes gene_type:complete
MNNNLKSNNMTYTIKDVQEAECNLEPLNCLHCDSTEVTYHQYIGDGYCSDCGEWQTLENDE